MLINLIEVSKELPIPIVKESTFGDFQLPSLLARKLESNLELRALKIDKNTSSYKTSESSNPQWVVFPNQYFSFASHFYSFASELIKYFKLLEQLQKTCADNGFVDTEIFYGTWSKIKQNIEEKSELFSSFENIEDLDLFCRFIDKDDNSYRLKGKSILNDNNGKGPISIRESAGCFCSIILTRINMPAVSAQGFGDLVWSLIKVKDVYLELSQYHNKIIQSVSTVSSNHKLPKPFLLLAGISGTGKTRFVREQAAAHNKGNSNYCLIPVRPDWHEPSDLLGYISRIGLEGPCYVVTKLLVFIVAAWQNAFFSVEENKLICKHAAEMTPYWLCLDEMNLAPVEQYFADYLSVLETRKWENEEYSCDPLLVSDTIKLLKPDKPDIGQEKLRKDLKLIGEENDALWAYFLNNGISIPPNLIVAGTVNMDETTHGFSRKVIDRAFTIDFGVFYPNDYGHYFESPIRHKTLSFPLLSQVSQEDLSVVSADTDGQNSIDFLTAINTVLKGTPFELAYRALNELLLAVVSFAPKDDLELQAVWDDFLMSKVLPRIDGDTEKLSNSVDDNSSDILSALLDVIDISFKEILIKNQRLDLLRENKDEKEKPLMISCRSKQKLEWMKARLTLNGFTTFWP